MLYHHVDIVCFFDEGDRGIQDIKNTVDRLCESIEFRMGYDCGDFEDYKPAPWNHKKKKGADDNIIVFGLSW